jgi:acetoin utilization deacetylase AcuC-like enzyme
VRATERLYLATHPDCRLHEPFPGHPERPRRLDAALAGARLAGAEAIEVAVDEEVCLEAIARVHDPSLAARLRAAVQQVPAIFDSDDNPIGSGSYRGAIAAVAASLAAVERALASGAGRVFAAVRPPGHHALRDRAMGFCFFNNAAIAAEELVARGVTPVAIVDFDVHHGNGTQDHFYRRPDVYFLSLHRYPFYPGSGAGDEIGAGPGRGFTRNLPLAVGADDAIYGEAIDLGLTELLRAVTPAAWVVSAGFDAHAADPLGGMRLTDEGFARIGATLAAACRGTPLVAVLEGGYHLEALQRSVRAFLASLHVTAAS